MTPQAIVRGLNYCQLLLTNNAVAGSATAAPDGTITSATLTGATLRPLAYAAPSLLETFNVGATATHQAGRLKLGAGRLNSEIVYLWRGCC